MQEKVQATRSTNSFSIHSTHRLAQQELLDVQMVNKHYVWDCVISFKVKYTFIVGQTDHVLFP